MHIGVPVVATDSSVGLRVTQATRNTLAELFVADVFECRHDSAKSHLPQGLAGFFGTTADLCWGRRFGSRGFRGGFGRHVRQNGAIYRSGQVHKSLARVLSEWHTRSYRCVYLAL
jgi:hypothetical protein